MAELPCDRILLRDNGILLVIQDLPVGNIVLATEPVNVTVTQQFVLMPAVDVVPTTNKLQMQHFLRS
jgi:hypothetical protein